MEDFYRTHKYLVEHCNAPVRRVLMDEVDWNARMIGIKGTRGIGKTTFLLQYIKERYGPNERTCLYVNMNNFYFQGLGIADFAGKFYKRGGRVLLIDQVYKQSDWSQELRRCYELYPKLKIIFTGSSVMRLKSQNPELEKIVKSYNLRGLSFREYLNLETGSNLPPLTLTEILHNKARILDTVLCYAGDPLPHFERYVEHGFYPLYREHTDFADNLLKAMNMMTEVDILLIKQIELKYLTKIKKLFYLLAVGHGTLNISRLADEIKTSRATVMNYIKYLADARLINVIYPPGQHFPKKPTKVMLHNPNLFQAVFPIERDRQTQMETFFVNTMWKDHRVNQATRDDYYIADSPASAPEHPEEPERHFRITSDPTLRIQTPSTYYCQYANNSIAPGMLPLWMLGFLY